MCTAERGCCAVFDIFCGFFIPRFVGQIYAHSLRGPLPCEYAAARRPIRRAESAFPAIHTRRRSTAVGIQRKNSMAKAAETQSRKRNRKTEMYIRASHYARTLLYFAKAFPVPCPRKRRFRLQTSCLPQKRSFSECKCRAEASGGRNRREIQTAAFLFACK